ncbi:hypothetical protein [Haloarchaeobius sp. DFWS5]|uniref:hypothetical protein n=1 Tax=Haloarchaeobius sp. DFWS5 TaxID=3446114 RepID=UPI003EBB6381
MKTKHPTLPVETGTRADPSWRTTLRALRDQLTLGRTILAILVAVELLWLAWFVTPVLAIVAAFGFVLSLLIVVPYIAVRLVTAAM